MKSKPAAYVALALLLPLVVYAATETSALAGRCMTCHKETTPGLYKQWFQSAHALHGVTCYDCHQAARSDADAFEHEGAHIATLVTPGDCGRCHTEQAEQFTASYHATAGQILHSNDAYLAHAVGGDPAAVAGCASCHGGVIKTTTDSPNHLAAGSWPNSGIGRINPDGTQGACTACHTRHVFSLKQVRQPETCGKCHLGPDHPQKEIYEESKHGIAYYTNVEEMNLASPEWRVGVDYHAAPTCATCHVSPTRGQALSHDIGTRISWTLRPIVSKHTENWEQKRGDMQEVCSACHSAVFVQGHYNQFDGLVNLYNYKFAGPAKAIMDILKKNNSMPSPAAFSNKLEWTFWELWHHEGRRARHGAAMMGPDYTWWHGIYDVGQHFYFKFLPEVRELGDTEANAYIDQLLQDPMHQWMSRPTAQIKEDIRSGRMQELYQSFYQPVMGRK